MTKNGRPVGFKRKKKEGERDEKETGKERQRKEGGRK